MLPWKSIYHLLILLRNNFVSELEITAFHANAAFNYFELRTFWLRKQVLLFWLCVLLQFFSLGVQCVECDFKGIIGANLYFTGGVIESKSSNFTIKLIHFLYSLTPFKPSNFENKICAYSLLLLLPACGLTLILLVPAWDSLWSYLSLHEDSDCSYWDSIIIICK